MRPHLLGLLTQLEIAGDDALLRMAQARYDEAGLGGEIYPENPDELERLLPYLPSAPSTAHLPRWLDVTHPGHRDHILEFARRAGGRLYGLNIHDQRGQAGRAELVAEAYGALDRRLAEVEGQPQLFVEYSGALSPAAFAELFEAAPDVAHVSACVDVGHVGIRAAAQAYAAETGGDIFQLRPHSPELPAQLAAVDRAVAKALPAVVALVCRLGVLGRPLHFHLHDGHPLSRVSRWAVSDHLSFLEQIPIPVEHRGRRLLGGMFGPAGLRAIVAGARAALPRAQLSFMVELHPREGRASLGEHARHFGHWTDRTNAERMAYWLDTVLANAVLLAEVASAGE